MELTSGETPWQAAEDPPSIASQLNDDLRTDVVVIGAGLTGALVADALSERGIDAVVVERREIAAGSTQASTALLQYDLDVPLVELADLLGRERAVRAFLLGMEGIELLEEKAAGLDCGFERRRSLYVASSTDSAQFLRREFEVRKSVGLPVSWTTADRLRSEWGLHAPGAIASERAAQVDPVRFTQALLHRSQMRGVRVFENVRIERIQESTGVHLIADEGRVINARWAVHAGGYEAVELLPSGSAEVVSTFAFISKPVQPQPGAWADRAVLWEHADPYMYARWTDDRVMVGGEDAPVAVGCEEMLSDRCERLRRKFAAWMPALELEVDASWCGPLAATDDGMGFIGPLRAGSPVLLALCYGGNGSVHAAKAIQIVLDCIDGDTSADADLFLVDRFVQ
jgi:glycine/D-amino acid oxidase-like deaminating enzyme